jgi:hypothetical protein
VIAAKPRTLAETAERDPAVKAVLEMPFANYFDVGFAPERAGRRAVRSRAAGRRTIGLAALAWLPVEPTAPLKHIARRSWTSSAIPRKSLATPII